MRKRISSGRVVIAVLAAVFAVGALAPAVSAHERGVVHLTFDKSAVSPGVWQGTVSGDVSGDLETRLLAATADGAILHVTFDWIVDAGQRSFTARLTGTLNTETGRVKMRGTVIEGWHLGARVSERGQLVDPATSRFTGTIKIRVGRDG
jgi:hypothetical protein